MAQDRFFIGIHFVDDKVMILLSIKYKRVEYTLSLVLKVKVTQSQFFLNFAF